MEDSEHLLIQAIGNGDTAAFESLLERYRGPVLNFIHRTLGDREAAEDLTQEVFLKVYTAAPRFEPRGKVSTWVFQIAYRLCLNEWKRKRRLHGFLERFAGYVKDLLPPVWVHPSDDRDLEADLLRALDRLPERQRAALLLRAREGLSYQEIGRVMEVSVSGVESLLCRARTRLKVLLLDGSRKEED